METPVVDPRSGQNLLFKDSGGAIPQEDGSVMTGGSLDEVWFRRRQAAYLCRPGPVNGVNSLVMIVV
jgi:hypothetical protein